MEWSKAESLRKQTKVKAKWQLEQRKKKLQKHWKVINSQREI